ncbi:MAG TPA: YkgJ family cysteine cluster protein [Aquabacterium sp.]|nr:YkgJ family cysteine cluster protein [Aquabacterium sp.]
MSTARTDATPAAQPACRPGCAACCTAPSISSPIPGMPLGKPAGVACVQLDGAGRCRIFGRPERPDVCRSLQPSAEMCGDSRAHAMHWLVCLEAATAPAAQPLAAGASAAPGPAEPA